ncbi:hypothetical protein NE398_20940 [Clostridium tertium]|uniref:Uncharacterized protein n=1 Tax=Clostridium tertium TaxID=1559 RepID=A0A9X3XP02_9CLOT|nr:hypothetical protein [Clostridium tertium]MDC4242593.1 hypothetical protein [Clostridium tertium]
MSKMIKTTDTDIKIEESIILVVEIGTLSFEIDERYPWIDVYLTGGESKEFVTQIDEENMPVFVEHEELKIYCLNWYFNNVEIIASEDIERTAPEVLVQEQSIKDILSEVSTLLITASSITRKALENNFND